MNHYTPDMFQAMAQQKMSRLRNEADRRRQIRAIQPAPRGMFERLTVTIGQGLLSIAKSFKVDRRPQLPAI